VFQINNIVFIEGVSGVGKTTASTLLYNKIQDMGLNVSCFLEGDDTNPLDPFKGTYPPPVPISLFSEIYMQCWQEFTINQSDNNFILILDGTFFHHQINDLICEYNTTDEFIINHLVNLLEVVQKFKPVVFYLSSSDIAQRLNQACESRKKPIPTDDKIAFWENRKRIDLLALDKLPVESHILNIDGGWDEITDIITDVIIG